MAALDNTYVVSYQPSHPTGSIVIKHPGGSDIIIPTNSLWNFGNTGVIQNDNDADFVKNQNTLRVLDIFKDADVKGAQIKEASTICQLFQTLSDCPDRRRDAKAQRNAIKTIILEAMKHKYTRKSLVKINGKYQYDELLPSRHVFQESGLTPESMIDQPEPCHTLASQVIDPAGRTKYKAGDHVFPEVGERLNMDQSFLSLFGFTNCSIQSKRTSNISHRYLLSLNGVNIRDDQHTFTEMKDEIDYFCGNSIKNTVIEKYFAGANSDLKSKLSALLVAKEMGDVIQVLTAFIYQHVKKDVQYTITTCDMIVMMLCLLLEVKCITVGHFGSEDNPDDKNYSSFVVDKYTNLQKYNHIMNEVELLLSMNEEMITYLRKLPLIELIDKNGMVHHTVHDFRIMGNEFVPIYAELRFIENILHDMEQIQEKAKELKDGGFFKTPSDKGVADDGADSKQDTDYHAELQDQFDQFESRFRMIHMFRVINDKMYLTTTLSTYTTIPTVGIEYDLQDYNQKTPFYVLLKRNYTVNPFIQSVSGTSRGVSRGNPVPLTPRRKAGTAFSKQIKKKVKSQTKKASKWDDDDTDDDVKMDGGGIGQSVKSHRSHRSHRTMRKSVKKSMKKRPNPFVMDFYPVYYEYWSDAPGELGEELEAYLGASKKREWKRVDLHAVLKKQLSDYLATKSLIRARYESDLLTYMYHDFLLQRRTLFGKPLEGLLNRIVEEHILPAHRLILAEEKREASLRMKSMGKSARKSARKSVGKSTRKSSTKKSVGKSTRKSVSVKSTRTKSIGRKSVRRPRVSFRPVIV